MMPIIPVYFVDRLAKSMNDDIERCRVQGLVQASAPISH